MTLKAAASAAAFSIFIAWSGMAAGGAGSLRFAGAPTGDTP
jgi:hypothetical protein